MEEEACHSSLPSYGFAAVSVCVFIVTSHSNSQPPCNGQASALAILCLAQHSMEGW